MIGVLQGIFRQALDRLSQHLNTFVPPLIVACAILAIAYLSARLVRWLITRAFKGIALDRFLKESGVSSILDRSGRLRGAGLVAGFAYWAIIILGCLTAVDVFDTKLTSAIVEGTVFLFPKLLTTALILLIGFWAPDPKV